MGYELTKDSLSKEWGTPRKYFDPWNREFGFELDVCAAEDGWNAKLPDYYTPSIDGLCEDWAHTNWCNPPYGSDNISAWLNKGMEEQVRGNTTVFLLPDTLDVAWFHEYVWDPRKNQWRPGIEFRPVQGRITFDVPPALRGRVSNGNPKGSILVVMRPIIVARTFACPNCGYINRQ